MTVSASHTRRTALRVAGAGLSMILGGCGFALRRPAELKVETVRLKGFAPRSPMADDLRRAIEARGTARVVEAEAQVVLESLTDARERVSAASTTTGLVRELTLTSRFKFRVTRRDGTVAIGDTELALSRGMSYNETVALAKEHEAESIYRSMQADIVAQVMRRLATVTP